MRDVLCVAYCALRAGLRGIVDMKLWLYGLLLSAVLGGCSTGQLWERQYVVTHKDPSQDGLPEEFCYGKPSPETLRNIRVARISLTQAERAKLTTLPNDNDSGVTWLKEMDPDTSRQGPWKTQLYIFDNNDTNHCWRIDLINHVSGGVRHEWLNDDVLSVEVWWGHVAFTDFFLDVSTGKFIYMRDGMEMPVIEDSLLLK